MKPATILIGLGSGLAAMLLLAALLTGTSFAVPLFILSPLPLAIAGLAWGPAAGVIGAVTLTVGVGFTLGFQGAVVALFLFAGPIVWMTRLLYLWRVTPGGEREWYPLGRALLHATLLVALGILVVGITVDFDTDRFAASAIQTMETWFAQTGSADFSEERLAAMTRLYANLLPYIVAAGVLSTLVLNTWLAARIAEASGKLRRARIPAWTAEFPQWMAGILVVAALAALLPGSVGNGAAAVAGAVGFGFTLVGLATLHAITRDYEGRGFLLFLAYALVLFFGVALVILAAIGVIDSFLHLRARFGRPSPSRPLNQNQWKE